MPRYQIPIRPASHLIFPDATAFVWWDDALQTFVGEVRHVGGPADANHMVVRMGTTPGALPTARAFRDRMWPWAVISDTLLAQLTTDQDAHSHQEESA